MHEAPRQHRNSRQHEASQVMRKKKKGNQVERRKRPTTNVAFLLPLTR